MSKVLKRSGLIVLAVVALCAASCNPDAKWTTKDVTVDINVYTVSAGYVECSFRPSDDAYYLIACEPARPGFDPLDPKNQKQFMTLALDSAEAEYLAWRYDLLKEGEFNIAPFASHCLQYGAIDHFFTSLEPNTNYWIYAFVVNPDKTEPAGKLFLKSITTTDHSVFDVHFEYRVQGYWDYIYPLNPDGKINNHFPYLAATVDSASLEEIWENTSPEEYFTDLFLNMAKNDPAGNARYGVQVVKNDGWNSSEVFEQGHTYYTAIASFDGFVGNNVIYKFTWTGEDFAATFTDEDSIVSDGEND